MGKDLHNLIRLHDWQVDERQRALADLLRAVAALEAKVRQLEDDLARERQAAAEAPGEIGIFYGSFAKATIARRRDLEGAIAEAEREVEAARDRLRAAYRELKKYEVVQARRESRRAAERDSREKRFLDEVGIQAFVRKGKPRSQA